MVAAKEKAAATEQQHAAWQYVEKWFAEEGVLFGETMCADIRNQVACIRAEAAQKHVPMSQVAETIRRTELSNEARLLAAALLMTAKEYVEGEAAWTKFCTESD